MESKKMNSEEVTKLRENIYHVEQKHNTNVTFDIDDENLEIYVNGWYLGDVNIFDLTPEARYEIGLDLNYKGTGDDESRPDRA